MVLENQGGEGRTMTVLVCHILLAETWGCVPPIAWEISDPEHTTDWVGSPRLNSDDIPQTAWAYATVGGHNALVVGYIIASTSTGLAGDGTLHGLTLNGNLHGWVLIMNRVDKSRASMC